MNSFTKSGGFWREILFTLLSRVIFFETPLADRRVNLNGLNITIAKDVTSTPVNSMEITDARIAINKLIV
jgi:hypothetical protein